MADSTVNLDDITIDSLNLPQFRENNLHVQVLRLDKIHPEISGNKWFKLKYYLEEGRLGKKKTLISFGGPYSNHLVALACAAHAQGFSSVGFIRGEQPAILSPALFTARKYGMDLQFLSRDAYQDKGEPAFLSSLQFKFPEAIIIPEGGAGAPGVRGAEEILSLLDTRTYSHICCAVGTGTTLAGLVNASLPHQQITGISVLKGTRDLEPLDRSLIRDREKLNRVHIIHDHHFGGYARKTDQLLDFMNELYEESGIPTDFVYTGKLVYAVSDLARTNYFPKDSRVLIIHSGGLQGNLSLTAGQLHF
jgi:1-aminocyclopropane-1-carboxylate deaminase/D-cysteine desulfhydrase-like pyridoxal-dependent ACC family enzyme